MKILCDADFIVYKACAAAESEVDFGNDVILVTSNFSDAYNATKRELTKIENKLGAFSDIILFFSDSQNFRKKILPSYKGHRNRKKPCGCGVVSHDSPATQGCSRTWSCARRAISPLSTAPADPAPKTPTRATKPS